MFNPKNNDFEIEDRSQLIYALTEAVSLEHLLMCQYIFAAASLKTHLDELRPSDRRYHQIERIRYWKRKLYEVGREEMQHLAIAMNLLISVGGAPTFARPNFPAANEYYKTKDAEGKLHSLLMSLERFSGVDGDPLRTIRRFIRFERPQRKEGEEAALAADAVPGPNLYDTVGELYGAISKAFDTVKDAIVDVDDQYAPTDEDKQPVELRNRPPAAAIAKTPQAAKELVNQIIAQGEGYPHVHKDPRAHYRIFQRIEEDYVNELKADSNFEPARRCAPNPRLRYEDLADLSNVTPIDRATDGGLQFDLLQLFSGAYEVLIGFLSQLFGPIPGGSTPPAFRALETLTFLPYMSEVIFPLAEVLTQVPVKLGAEERLGPGFEVSSNDFLIPKLSIGVQLAVERIQELANSAAHVSKKLRDARLPSQASQVDFVAQTLALLVAELKSRVDFGWPPPPAQWDLTYSEIAPPANTFAKSFDQYPVLELYFEGIVQCRLATDPDGAAVARGIVGNGFAIGDEPDLDRVIYFTPTGATPRSHCPSIGVRVKTARLLRGGPRPGNVSPGREVGELIPQLSDAVVALIDGPKFEGRNHVVSEDGEPIQPFLLTIESLQGGIRLRRGTLGGELNDMTPLQRRGTGRYPVDGGTSESAMRTNLAIVNRIAGTQFYSPRDYTEARIAALSRDFEALTGTPREFGREGAELAFRIRSLQEGLKNGLELDARTIRWTRYFFHADYRHYLSAEPSADFGSLKSRVSLNKAEGADTRWLIDYHFGFFDTDAMTACLYGTLLIPVIVAA